MLQSPSASEKSASTELELDCSCRFQKPMEIEIEISDFSGSGGFDGKKEIIKGRFFGIRISRPRYPNLKELFYIDPYSTLSLSLSLPPVSSSTSTSATKITKSNKHNISANKKP